MGNGNGAIDNVDDAVVEEESMLLPEDVEITAFNLLKVASIKVMKQLRSSIKSVLCLNLPRPQIIKKDRKGRDLILSVIDDEHLEIIGYKFFPQSEQSIHLDQVWGLRFEFIDGEEEVVKARGSKKGWAWGRGKARGRGASQSGRGLIAPSPQSSCAIQCEASAKPNTKGPRMPDGTRGFTMGRGKP